MIKFIIGNQPAAQFLIAILVILHLSLFAFTQESFEDSLKQLHDANIYAYFWSLPTLSFILNASLIIVNIIFINFIFNSREFFDRNTYLPGFLFLVMISYFDQILFDYDTILSLTLFLLALQEILQIKQNEDARKLSFNTMFFIGVAAFINPVFFFFIPFFWFALTSVRPFVWREVVLSIAGLLCVILIMYNFSIDINSLKRGLLDVSKSDNKIGAYVFLTFVLTLLMLSVFSFLNLSNKTSIRFKRLIRMLFIVYSFGLVSAVAYGLYFGYFYHIALIIPPASLLFSIPLLYSKTNKMLVSFMWLFYLGSFIKLLI